MLGKNRGDRKSLDKFSKKAIEEFFKSKYNSEADRIGSTAFVWDFITFSGNDISKVAVFLEAKWHSGKLVVKSKCREESHG